MGNAKLLPAIGVFVLAAAAGCGDGPICQSEILLLIQTPQGVVLGDSNEDMEGVQTEVTVRSTLPEDVEVTLTVLDEEENEVFTDTASTDEDGDVTFEDVDLPDGPATIRVAADAGECGSDEDEVVIDVAAGRDCELTIRQEPLDNDFYAPLGVLNLSNDDNPAMPNFQADIDVTTAPGYDVELFVTGSDETSAGTETADDAGEATFAISLAQGRQVLRAVCTAPTGAVTAPSINTAVFVDTEGPECEMTGPADGEAIETADDADADDTNGIQLTFTAHADGGDVEGEATTFVLTASGSSTTAPGTDFDLIGNTSVDMTLAITSVPLTATVQLTGSDHAGNGCTIMTSYDIEYFCAPPPFGEIGGPCNVSADCGAADSFCYKATIGPTTFPLEGYCLVDDFSLAAGTCANDTDCPPGTECTGWNDFFPYRSCMPTCGCVGGGCPINQDCLGSFNGLALDATVCTPGNGNAIDGSLCQGMYQCDEYSACQIDDEYPGGQCGQYNCTLGDSSTCNGGHCVNADPPFAGTTCVDTCTTDADCRMADGYVCFDPDGLGSAQNYCRHPHIGDPCANSADCGGTAAAGASPLDLFWYDGGMKPRLPEEVETHNVEMGREGILFVGDEGAIMAGFHGQDPQIFAKGKQDSLWKDGASAPAAGQGRADPGKRHNPWLDAAQGGEPSPGSFLNAGPITDAVNLGTVALRAGKKVLFDSENLRITNAADANKYLHREYRDGWKL